MDFTLNDEQHLFRDEIIRFAEKELNDCAQARDRDGGDALAQAGHAHALFLIGAHARPGGSRRP